MYSAPSISSSTTNSSTSHPLDNASNNQTISTVATEPSGSLIQNGLQATTSQPASVTEVHQRFVENLLHGETDLAEPVLSGLTGNGYGYTKDESTVTFVPICIGGKALLSVAKKEISSVNGGENRTTVTITQTTNVDPKTFAPVPSLSPLSS